MVWVLICAGLLTLSAGCTERDINVRHPQYSALEPAVVNALAKARTRWQQALTTAPDAAATAQAFGELGKMYLANHFTTAAADCFALASGHEPGNFRWHYFHALALLETGDTIAARRELEQVLRTEPDFWPARYRLGKTLLTVGDKSAAQRQVALLLQAQPQDAAVLALAGELALNDGDYAAAAQHFEQALRLQPSATRLYHPLARAVRGLRGETPPELLARAGDGEVRVDDPFERALAPLAQSTQIFLERGKIALEQKNYAAAERFFRDATARDPDDAFARMSLGRVLEIRTDADGARAEMDRALVIDARSATAHYFRGALAERAGDDAVALGHYREAVEIDPHYDRPRLLLAHALLRVGDDESALLHYRFIAGRKPSNITSRFYLAMIHLSRGRCAAARRRLAEAAALQTNYAPVLEAQARLYAVCPADQNERDRALEIARSLMQVRPDSRSAATLAIVYAARGEWNESKRFAMQAVDLAPPGRRESLAAFLAGGRLPELAWPLADPDFAPPRLTANSLK